jgi:hypothetical protein
MPRMPLLMVYHSWRVGKPLRLRLLAFHSAGNTEDMWSSEGTGSRRSPSPLLVGGGRAFNLLLQTSSPGR